MPMTDAEKEDVLRKVAVEFERTFFILSNYYDRPQLQRMLPFLAEIETKIKEYLADLRSTAVSPTGGYASE